MSRTNPTILDSYKQIIDPNYGSGLEIVWYLRLDESLPEELSHVLLHGVGDLVGSQALEHDDLLEVIQGFVPLAWHLLQVRVSAVKDSLKRQQHNQLGKDKFATNQIS